MPSDLEVPALPRAIDRRTFLAAGGGAVLLAAGLPAAERLVVDGLDTSVMSEDFLDRVREGGVHCIHLTAYREDSFRSLHEFAAGHPKRVRIVASVAEIERARADGVVAVVLGVQAAGGLYGNGIDAAMDEVPLGSLARIRPALERYYALGLRIQGVCYNTYNVFGSGCLDHTVPLTRAGRRLVEEIHRLRIVLDIGGHAGERTSLDAVAMSAGVPVVVTHSNFAAKNPNMRCISDRLAVAVAKTGGVIGLTAVSDFLVRNATNAARHGATSPRAKLATLLDHYDYGKKLVGAEHLGVGPDFNYGQEPYDVNPADAVTFVPEALSAGPVRMAEGFAHVGEWPSLVAGLRGRGWTERELDLVLGANWLRVWKRVWA
jgi:membrane dipeptidase